MDFSMSARPLHNFNTIAPVYDALASCIFGKSIKEAQVATIPWIPEGAAVLIIGGGSGWYLRELLSRKNLSKIVYLEASATMLGLTRRKMQDNSSRVSHARLDLRLGTEENILPGEQFDVIVTHFFLDIFEPRRLEKVAQRIKLALKPEGLWLAADFLLSEKAAGIHYWWKKALVTSILLFFRFVSRITARELPHLPKLFASMHMTPVYEQRFYKGLIVSWVYVPNKASARLFTN